MIIMGRSAEIEVGGRVIRHPEIDVDIAIEFTTTDEANTAAIKIYNLSELSIDMIRREENIDVKQGYKNNIERTFRGIITAVKTYADGVDKVTEIKANDNLDKWGDIRINKTWKEGYKASDIAQQIISGLPISVRDFRVGRDKSYTDGKSYTGTARDALVELAFETGSKVHVDKGELVFRPFSDADSDRIRIDSNTGLMSRPEKSNNDGLQTWTVQTILNPRISGDSLLEIRSKSISGLYRVVKGKHRPDWTTECEVAKCS